MKTTLMYSFILICTAIHTQAQTTIDNLEGSTYLQAEATINSRAIFAGQSLGVSGPEVLPSIKWQHASGLYAQLSPTLYTDKKITKKAILPELNATLGYTWSNDNFATDIGYTYSKVNFGNSFFRQYLAHSICWENTYYATEQLELGATLYAMGGARLKRNHAVVASAVARYNATWQNALGAQQVTLTPNLEYYFGSDRVAATFGKSDSLSSTSSNTANVGTLSLVPGVQAVWQKNYHELTLAAALPWAKNTTLATMALQAPVYSLGYAYYFAFGKREE